jgi:dTDP-4-amino-4,6-dideoxygalactose transaminase
MGIDSLLAIHGGQPVRTKKMPCRQAFGEDEIASLMEAVEYYKSRNQDPPYQGYFEQKFCGEFAEFCGGGYADAVATGTAAVYVALAALEIPKKSEVITSPATDSGPLNSIIFQGFVPVVADSKPNSYNMGVEQFLERVTSNTKAVLAVHLGGEPLEIDQIVSEAHKRGIRVLEDCCQAPGAVWKNERVGTFGDVAAFSTMYRKTLSTGGSGGIVYTKNLETYKRVVGHADRGKPQWEHGFVYKDPTQAIFPALNFNTDEFSCAIGLASLRRLQDTINKRVAFVSRFVDLLKSKSRACTPYSFHTGFSPFFFPVFVDTEKITCSKIDFAKAVAEEGVELNPHYGCVVSAWHWAKPYLSDDFVAANSLWTRDHSFNIHSNERYGDEEAQDIIGAILKVERHYLRK